MIEYVNLDATKGYKALQDMKKSTVKELLTTSRVRSADIALGGGLSIFALVASMLGLFGSPILPSIVRMSSLNYFNYVTVISLFDVASITAGTTVFVWKLAILVAAGLAGYIAGACRFVKKDLPL